MKTLLILIIIFYIKLFGIDVFAQWSPDFRLTNNSAFSVTSFNNAWCIAASGSGVHVVWFDDRDGNSEIYYKQSVDGGVSWGTDTRLTNNNAPSNSPSIAVSGSFVHLVWMDTRDINEEIYYKQSTNGGLTWSADIRLTNNTAISFYPSVAVSGSFVYVVWMDTRDGNEEIYYKRSTNGGVSWDVDTRLTNNISGSLDPSVTVLGSFVHVVWYDERDANWEIYYKRSTDGGISWGSDVRLTDNTFQSEFPSITAVGSDVYVVWQDRRDGNYEIYIKKSTDNGVTWGSDIRLTNNTAQSELPSVAVSGSIVHIVWQDRRDGNREIYYKQSTDGGLSWSSDIRLTNNTASSLYPSIAISGQIVHVVWNDDRDGNKEIYYKRNPTGSPTGIKNIGNDIPKEYSLSQNYPNPFNPSTTISFSIPTSEFVTLKVYDVLGREVTTLVNENLNAGSYSYNFDASSLTSGVYLYKLQAGMYSETKKMILSK